MIVVESSERMGGILGEEMSQARIEVRQWRYERKGTSSIQCCRNDVNRSLRVEGNLTEPEGTEYLVSVSNVSQTIYARMQVWKKSPSSSLNSWHRKS